MDPLANIIRRQWKGEEPLWKAFWVYGMMAGTLLESVLALSLAQAFRDMDENFEGTDLFFHLGDAYAVFLSLAFSVTYGVWNFVSVWRCARNTGKALWRWSARAFYVLVMLYAFGTLTYMLVLGSMVGADQGS